MKKYKFYINFDKEEKWLNEMAKQGWELEKGNVRYEFRKALPSDTIIKIDYRTFKSKEDFENYITLFSDYGWKHISGTKTSGKQYFKKINDGADDDIFSDVSSKADRYKKLSDVWISLASSYIALFTVLVLTKTVNASAILNPKSLYYTPGLWEKNGISFWRAFLFETPFALIRGIGWFILPILIVLYVVFALKAQAYYKKKSAENQ